MSSDALKAYDKAFVVALRARFEARSAADKECNEAIERAKEDYLKTLAETQP